MGIPLISPAGFATWTGKTSRSSRLTARTSDVPFAGSRNQVSLCAHVMVAPTIKTVPAPPALQNAVCLNTTIGSKADGCSSMRAKCPRRAVPLLQISSPRYDHAFDRIYWRVARRAPSGWHVYSRNDGASDTLRDLQLVLRIRQRCLRRVYTSNRYRHHARPYLCAVCG